MTQQTLNFTARTPVPATAAQITYITKLRAEREMPALVIELTKSQASKMIDELKAKPPVKRVDPAKGPLDGLPLSKYALGHGETLRFYEIVERRGGRRFMNRLIGAPGDWDRKFVHSSKIAEEAQLIRLDPAAAAKRFAEEFTCCSVCLSPLSDETSRTLGLGPVCRKRFGL